MSCGKALTQNADLQFIILEGFCVGFGRLFFLAFCYIISACFSVLRLSFLFQKMLGQKRWVLPLLRPKTACWKTVLTRQYTNGPRKPANWYSGFTWPATEVSWGTWRCCIQMHVTGQCSVNDVQVSTVAYFKCYVWLSPLKADMFSLSETNTHNQFLCVAQQTKY